ncbi:histidine phosphatase family protein [Paenibacillus marinisediminis]
MNTIVYVVRHAESLFVEGKERTRGLTDRGLADALTIKSILMKENIDLFVSSPYERAVLTIQNLADACGASIEMFEDLRERTMGQFMDIHFLEAKRKLYTDRSFAFDGGESSSDAQQRAVMVMDHLLDEHRGKSIVIGTHGDIMTLMMNYYNQAYDFEFWKSMTMPDIYKLEFEGHVLNQVTRLWND